MFDFKAWKRPQELPIEKRSYLAGIIQNHYDVLRPFLEPIVAATEPAQAVPYPDSPMEWDFLPLADRQTDLGSVLQ